ncbi:MAG: FKBP-type peptidyl-prolyl cis-trans isomerase [Alphaproteobacteria bacterium]|nr:FKBP-type peptidyl-prolyl cis-trans isomerase [Alphaproteobacteria bacterium]MBF0251293.1 FKBP-type peptidyl-prolyl cis-trans isomerase [Alphaproteobacteria bacterium]
MLAVMAVIGASVFAAASSGAFTKGGVQITDVVTGTGQAVKTGDRVKVNYTGWTMDGNQFDSSVGRKPFVFPVGRGQVIPGWEVGVEGMRVGGKRELIIPSDMAYGAAGVPGVIPPNSTLKFEVELLEILGAPYTDISNDQLKALLARGVPIIDLRRAEEWVQTGVVEGSHLITAFDKTGRVMPDFVDKFTQVVKPEQEVVIICRTGNRTAAIAGALNEQLGYAKIFNVTRGITDWIKAGNTVIKPQG